MRASDFVNEVSIDNKNGWGAVPFNQDVDYFGLRVLMKPSTFLKLAAALGEPPSADIEKHVAGGGSIGAPFLDVGIPPGWSDGDLSQPARIRGHEGRNRMHAILKVEGDNPVEVHVIPGGGLRARHLTPDFVKKMNQGMIAERSTTLVPGPLFAIPTNESVLTERGSDILFHSTQISAALNILATGKIELSSSVGSNIETEFSVKGYHYYLSTSRTLTGDYHTAGMDFRNAGVMLDLDGRWIGQRYPVRPIDYWGQDWLRNGRSSESEDRVFSKDSSIPIRAITSVHVYIQHPDKNDSPRVRKILLLAKTRGIPVYLYRNTRDWMTQSTARAVKSSEFRQLLSGPEFLRTSNRKPIDYAKPWLELITATDKKQLSPAAEKLRYDLMVYHYSSPDINRLQNDLGNSRRAGEHRESLVKLVDYLRRNRMSLEQFQQAMFDKWKGLTQKSS